MKKPRRDEQPSSQLKPNNVHLPSPLTGNGQDSSSCDDDKQDDKNPTTPISNSRPQTPEISSPKVPSQLRSPPSDTQQLSQFMIPAPYSYEVQDEEAEGVWGYLISIDSGSTNMDTLVLKRRSACPMPMDRTSRPDGKTEVDKEEYKDKEEEFEKKKIREIPASGILIGRHPECGIFILQ